MLADSIGNGLEEQLEALKTTKPDLKLVVIDTLQKVRSSTDSGYGIDYKELTPLKILADKMEIAILLVHHTRKSFDADPFNMISGTTGMKRQADLCRQGHREPRDLCSLRQIPLGSDRQHRAVQEGYVRSCCSRSDARREVIHRLGDSAVRAARSQVRRSVFRKPGDPRLNSAHR